MYYNIISITTKSGGCASLGAVFFFWRAARALCGAERLKKNIRAGAVGLFNIIPYYMTKGLCGGCIAAAQIREQLRGFSVVATKNSRKNTAIKFKNHAQFI